MKLPRSGEFQSRMNLVMVEVFYIGMLVVRTDGLWVYGHVITKFSRMGRLPHFLAHGATLHESSSMIPVPHFFFIPVNFAFNLPHYVTSYMHHTGKKESKKINSKKKRKKSKVTKNLLQGIPTRTVRIS